VRILLDTHTLLWAILTPQKLSPPASKTTSRGATVLVSPDSVLDITTKVRLGKLPDIPIVSADPKLDSFGVQRIW
jgi:PIN domain nuclease of toxin-antitoxin system